MKLILVATAAVAFAAAAQAQGVPNPFSGMGRDSDKPISIAADATLEGRKARFRGGARVRVSGPCGDSVRPFANPSIAVP